ncbi:helix-turn-helix transcriptional regulator [Pelomonas sp. V22]|uniref:helix-turn-helix domain-containing protein n=1 Tax=Pelomonas sp. V22 TaxID=2822139 RepID=UPI0024A99023|nr:helix-turn-helix transcriptional regulator [Pelomonas sp. V22]MDI4635211.1 helix-turn-helix transcriptional regulator [Pelomonas sp. V22]
MPKSLHSRHNEIFLTLLRGLRKARRLRQADLADRLGRAQGLVSKVERGERRLDVIELRDWLSALDTDFIGFVTSLDAELQTHVTTDLRVIRRRGTPRAASRKRGCV